MSNLNSFVYLGFVTSLRTNPTKHIWSFWIWRKVSNPNSYAMPKCTSDIFSPLPSNWLRPEVKMTIPESCEMQKKKLCQVRFSIFSKLYQSVFHWFQIDFFIILQTFVCAAIFNKIFMLHFWTSFYKTE